MLSSSNQSAAPSLEEYMEKAHKLQQQLEASQHEHRKELLEARTELEYYEKRSTEYEEKYLGAIKYQHEEGELRKILTDLQKRLSEKEEQELAHTRVQHERKKKAAELQAESDKLRKANEEYEGKIKHMHTVAIQAITDKDTIIAELKEKISNLESETTSEDNRTDLSMLLIEAEGKCRQLSDELETNKADFEEDLKQRDEEIKDLTERSETMKDRYEDRIRRLEGKVIEYENEIESIQQQQHANSHTQQMEEQYQVVEAELRRSEKKIKSYESNLQQLRQQIENLTMELQHKQQAVESSSDEAKSLRLRVKELEREARELQRETKMKARQLEEQKHITQRVKNEWSEKLRRLEEQKQKLSQDIEALATEQLNKSGVFGRTGNSPAFTGAHEVHLELEATKVQLAKYEAELNGYESDNNLIIIKLKHAQDQSYWKTRQSSFLQQQQETDRNYKKQISQLLARIDKIKRVGTTTKRTDYYYQSGLQ